MRPTLCLPIDVMRKFDPQVTEDALHNIQENVSPIGNNDNETIVSRIEGLQSQVTQETGRPWRKRQVGIPDNSDTWVTPLRVEYQKNGRFPRLFCDLSHEDIVELHGVEIRKTFDEFRSISLDNVSLNPHTGTLSIRRSYLPSQVREWIEHQGYNVRVSYSYGAFGGSDNKAGQTHITENITHDTPTVTVDSVANLPPTQNTMLLGDEYVVARPTGTNEVELVDRGIRGTSARDHNSGSGLHYCPINVREGVAAKAAIELVTYIDKIDEAVGEQFSPQEKRDVWQGEWDDLIKTSGSFGSL